MYDVSGIRGCLNQKIFGQHLAVKIVSKTLESHLSQENPKKPLVLSFHGWTGCGKNFVSDIIAKHLFKKGRDSKFVKIRIATLHYRHEGKLQEYQTELKALVESSTKNCSRSLFIFDEVDKMPEGLADVLKPYLDYHDSLEGTDYRKNIFIFLSNTAGDKINNFVLNHLVKCKLREDISSVEMGRLLSIGAFNMAGGLKNADIVLSALIDFYVPFLPLERIHIKQCAAAELKRRNVSYNDTILENIASEMLYFPEKEKLFSLTGCKSVANKVDIFV